MDNRIGYTSENLKAVVDKFYQMPRFLDSGEFENLSIYAKMLYVYLLDRLKLSLSSNWFDEENGQVYMYFKREDMQKALKLTSKTVKKVVDELKAHNLMAEKVQGINLPNRIFLYAPIEGNCNSPRLAECETNAPPKIPTTAPVHEGENFPHGQGIYPPSGMEKFPPRTGNISTSGHGNIPMPEGEKFPPIKNESNKNEHNQNEAIKNEGIKTTTTVSKPEDSRNASPTGAVVAEALPKTGSNTPVDVPFEEIKAMYNQICQGLRGIVSINGKRRSQVSARFKEYGIEGLQTLFEFAANSTFLCGGGERGWKADFDWLIATSNMQKVLEGKYDNDNQAITIPGTPLPDTGQGIFYAPMPDGVIEIPINPIADGKESTAAVGLPDFSVLYEPNPARAAKAAQYPNYRNKNGFNTMAALQLMLEAEEAKEGRLQREDVAV